MQERKTRYLRYGLAAGLFFSGLACSGTQPEYRNQYRVTTENGSHRYTIKRTGPNSFAVNGSYVSVGNLERTEYTDFDNVTEAIKAISSRCGKVKVIRSGRSGGVADVIVVNSNDPAYPNCFPELTQIKFFNIS